MNYRSATSGPSSKRTRLSPRFSRPNGRRTRDRPDSTSSTSWTPCILSTSKKSWPMRISKGWPAAAKPWRSSPLRSPSSGRRSSNPCPIWPVSSLSIQDHILLLCIFREEWQDFAFVEVLVQIAAGRQEEKEGPAPRLLHRVQGVQEAGETPGNEFAIAKWFRNGSSAESCQVLIGRRKKEEMKFAFCYVICITFTT